MATKPALSLISVISNLTVSQISDSTTFPTTLFKIKYFIYMKKYKEWSSPVYPPTIQEIKYCKDSWSFLHINPCFFLRRWFCLLFNKENKTPLHCNPLGVLPSVTQTSLLPSAFPPVFCCHRRAMSPFSLVYFSTCSPSLSLPHYHRPHTFLIRTLFQSLPSHQHLVIFESLPTHEFKSSTWLLAYLQLALFFVKLFCEMAVTLYFDPL